MVPRGCGRGGYPSSFRPRHQQHPSLRINATYSHVRLREYGSSFHTSTPALISTGVYGGVRRSSRHCDLYSSKCSLGDLL